MTMTALSKSDTHGFRFGTKAQTLASLAGKLRRSALCEQMTLSTDDWAGDRAGIVKTIIDRFQGHSLAIRSSSSLEDGMKSSNAGAFESVIDVPCAARDIEAAIDKVNGSYGQDARNEEILVQEMVRDVALSGVVLTRDLDRGGPYYAINYDDFSGRTDTVTGGSVSKIVMVHRSRPEALRSPRMRQIIDAVREIEAVTGLNALDIEFCATGAMDIYVLQVRPVAARRSWSGVTDGQVDQALADTRTRVAGEMKPKSGLAGSTTAFGVMPDWNPAEMIGRSPRRLALSLYRRLITDQVWNVARTEMGYRRVDGPLLVEFVERPYIDVRASFNSLLPAALDESIADRLIDWQVQRLSELPGSHDKVEFDIALTCRDFSFADRIPDLTEAGLSGDEIGAFEQSLHDVTQGALKSGADGLRALLSRAERSLLDGAATDAGDPLALAKSLLDDTARDGTLPFAILARHAFIAVSFLKSMVARGVLTQEQSLAFFQSIRTVAAAVVSDMAALSSGKIDRCEFLNRYGHLRPGTYDILSWRYDERPDLYLSETANRRIETPVERGFALSSDQQRSLVACLKDNEYDITPADLLDYMATAIYAREQAKFAFTRGVSDALRALCAWGDSVGLGRDDLSHIRIEELLSQSHDQGGLKERAEDGRTAHALSLTTRLHHLIFDPDDIDVVYPARGEPTFITSESITAPGAVLDSGQSKRARRAHRPDRKRRSRVRLDLLASDRRAGDPVWRRQLPHGDPLRRIRPARGHRLRRAHVRVAQVGRADRTRLPRAAAGGTLTMNKNDYLLDPSGISPGSVPRFDFHMHTTWTDGTASVSDMYESAVACGLEAILFSEHSRTSSGDWFPDFASEVRALPQTPCRAFVGTEVKVNEFDGTLDLAPEVHALVDLVVVSVHRFPDGQGGLREFRDVGPDEAERIEFELSLAALTNPDTDMSWDTRSG